MAKSDNRCANCGGKFGLVCYPPLGPALLPQGLQGQLPCENGKGLRAYEDVLWLLGSREDALSWSRRFKGACRFGVSLTRFAIAVRPDQNLPLDQASPPAAFK